MMMVKKATGPLLSRPLVRYFYAPLAVGFVLWAVDRAVPNLNLLREIAKGFVWVHHLKIPGTIFLLVVIGAAVVVFRLGKRRQISVDAIDQRMEEVKKPDTLTLTDEQYLVLVALAGGKDSWTDDPLFELYTKYFPKKQRLHFNLLIDDLDRRELLNATHNYSGETFYTILPKGRDIVRGIVNKLQAPQPQEATTDPNLPPKRL